MTERRAKSDTRAQDPHRAREAKKYQNPIPSREFILQVLGAEGPLEFVNLARVLELTGEPDLVALERRVGAMERDGQLVRNRKGLLCQVNKRELVAGRVIGHPDGFGFLKPDDGGDDLFLSAREMRKVYHDDRAVARVIGLDRRGRPEGAILEVLERHNRLVVGRLYVESGVGFVVPDNKRLTHDIIIPRDALSGAEQGQIVVAEIVEQPTKRTQPIGRVIEVLGQSMAPGMETDIAIRSFDIPVEWPPEVLEQSKDFTEQVPEEAKREPGRVDLRALPLVTIDGADARDFDDAVYCETRPNDKGWRLLVCIADVSAYVARNSALDQEASRRGNSTYFPDRVIPMLPEVLSNGLCSLNPNVDRLCMACELRVDPDGNVSRSRFFPAVMRSQARLTYDEVAALLESGDAAASPHGALLPQLQQLYAMYRALLEARRIRGAMDFESTETRFIFDGQGKIAEIVPVARNEAHRLIEECMLAANVAAARLFQRRKLPALYRIHEGPTQEKLAELRDYLAELGLSLAGGEKPQALDYARLMERVRERPDAHLIQTRLLRSLAQAVYSATNRGHFGLAYPAYTHFTSPIRRYPDLIVHRAIKHLLADGDAADFEYSLSALQGIGEQCSMTERRSDEAAWDVQAWLKCEFMQDKLGEEFDGTISGVSSFGIFVELDNIYVDGLVHITSLDNDYYQFDPVGHRLTGERAGIQYRLGDRLRVQVAAVNLDERKIDLVLAGVRPRANGGARRRTRS